MNHVVALCLCSLEGCSTLFMHKTWDIYCSEFDLLDCQYESITGCVEVYQKWYFKTKYRKFQEYIFSFYLISNFYALLLRRLLLSDYLVIYVCGWQNKCLPWSSQWYAVVPQSQTFGLSASKLFKSKKSSISASAAGNAAQASTAAMQENVLEWVKKDKRRMLHVVYRVGDLDRTIKYVSYTPLADSLYFSKDEFNWTKYWLQILHRVPRDEAAEEAWHTRGKIHKCLSWIWSRRFSFCDWTHLQ